MPDLIRRYKFSIMFIKGNTVSETGVESPVLNVWPICRGLMQELIALRDFKP